MHFSFRTSFLLTPVSSLILALASACGADEPSGSGDRGSAGSSATGGGNGSGSGGAPSEGGSAWGGGGPGGHHSGGNAGCELLPITTTRSWGSGKVSEVLAIVSDSQALWVAGYENAEHLSREGDSVGFVERWPNEGGAEQRYTSDAGQGDAVTALARDLSGRVWFAGYTKLQGSPGTGWDALVGWLDSELSPTMHEPIPLEASQVPTALAVEGEGLVVVGRDEVFVQGNAVERFEDGIALWIDASNPEELELDRTQRFATDAPDGFSSLAVWNESVWVGGWRSSGADSGGFVKVLTAEGVEDAEHRLAPGPISSIAALLEHEGELYVAGTTSSQLGAEQFGGQDGFFARLDEHGSLQEVVQFGTAQSEWIRAMARAEDGSFVIAGEVDADVGADIFAVRIADSGELVGRFVGGSPYDETVTSIAVDACGNAYVGGSSLGDVSGLDEEARQQRHAYVRLVEFE